MDVNIKIRKKLVLTPMFIRYMIDLVIRVVIFISVFLLYIIDKELLRSFTYKSIAFGIAPIHMLWAYFMFTMISHIFVTKKSSMAMYKAKKCGCEDKEFSRLELLEFVQNQNTKAILIILIWLSFNAIWGILYLCNVFDKIDLFMITIFYFLSDYICIMIYCPFQHFFMKNKCCVNCRIYDWGHFMMFTPMLFIQSFFSWSLFFTALVVLIRWEYYYAKYPERFWYKSNDKLQCQNCNEKLCQIKNKVKKGI